jgi:hypothetical protein
MSAIADGTVVSLEATGTEVRNHTCNAVGRLKGRDAAMANDAILLTAHLDHISITSAATSSPIRIRTRISSSARTTSSWCGEASLRRRCRATACTRTSTRRQTMSRISETRPFVSGSRFRRNPQVDRGVLFGICQTKPTKSFFEPRFEALLARCDQLAKALRANCVLSVCCTPKEQVDAVRKRCASIAHAANILAGPFQRCVVAPRSTYSLTAIGGGYIEHVCGSFSTQRSS